MKKIKKKILIYVLIAICLFQLPVSVQAKEENAVPGGCAVSIALDVSGSMKNTDPDRLSIELIKMFIDICGENDYFNVTAYNDEIVYTSGMVSMREAAEKEALKQSLDSIAFAGETDNGLGLYTATKAVADLGADYSNSFVLLISDGNTDLENSNSGRTLEDSNADLDQSADIAIEHRTAVNAVGYTSEYSKDINLLSVVTAATGGSMTLVDNAVNFIQVMISTFFSGYNGGKVNLTISEPEDLLCRQEFSLPGEVDTKNYAVIFATQRIQDFGITGAVEAPFIQGEHYVIMEPEESVPETITALYSFSGQAKVVTGVISASVIERQEPEGQEDETEQTEESASPVGKDLEQKVFTSKEHSKIDVSRMFSDEDQDIVGYRLKVLSGSQGRAELSGSMLSVDVSQTGTYSYQITAVDSHENVAEAVLSVEVIPAWKKYYNYIVGGIILAITAAAMIVCILIIRKTLFRKEKELVGISGTLYATFIDIKSKNESVDVSWDLEEYPPEGVSLLELFQSKQIMEDLKDLDKVCFYPAKSRNELLLVHCMEGGVFVGEQLMKANTPVKLTDGDVIYLSFAENASEIELRYCAAARERYYR